MNRKSHAKPGSAAHSITRARSRTTAAYHTYDVPTRPEITALLDARQRGLGTASCGPDTLGQYKILPGRYRLRYAITPLNDRKPARFAL